MSAKEIQYDPEMEAWIDEDGEIYSEDDISRADAYWEAVAEQALENFVDEAHEEALKTYPKGCYCKAIGVVFGDCGYCKLAEKIYQEKRKQWEDRS